MIFGSYFCGHKISDYGLEHNRVDYRTFAQAFDAVLNNEILEKTYDIGYWDQVNGYIDYTDEIDEIDDKITALEKELDEIDDDTKRDELQKQLDKLEEERDELQNEMDYPPEVYQWYIVSDCGANIIQSYTDEILYYNEELDMYLWGVTHWGTSWDYVLTNIKCNMQEGGNDE